MLTLTMLRRLRRAAPALAAAVLFAAAAGAQTAPSSVTGTPIGVSSITWSWSGGSGSGYRVITSTGGNVSGDLASTVSSFTWTELSTNTATQATIEAFIGASVADASPVSVYTQAAQPTGSALLSTNGTQSTLSWYDGTNPVGTRYNVDWNIADSTSIVFSTASVSVGSVTATIDNLPSAQTVYFQVQAVNGDGVGSTFDVLLSTTIAAIFGQDSISSGTYALGVSSIAWSWSASTGAINYQLFEDSGVAASPLLGPNQLSYTQTSLSTNTLYTDYIEAFSLTSSTNSAPFSRYTLAAPTTGLLVISSSPANVSANLSWGADGNPPDTTYQVEWWTNLTSTVTASTQAANAALTGLYGGSTVYFTIQAKNGDGLLSGYDSTLTGPSALMPFVFFSSSVLNVPLGAQGTLNFVLPTAVVSVTFSSSTFTEGVNMYVQQVAESSIVPTPATPPDVQPITVGSPGTAILFQITAVDGGGAPQKPLLPLIVSVTYNPAQINGVNPGALTINYDDPVHGWVPLATSKGANDDLHAVANAAGYYQVFGISAPSDLSQISVGPNPLRPTLNAGQRMTFRNLPPGTRVRIFTYLGEKLADVAADDSGIAAWDGSNAAGKPVASGVYIAVIQGGGVKKLMRVAVER